MKVNIFVLNCCFHYIHVLLCSVYVQTKHITKRQILWFYLVVPRLVELPFIVYKYYCDLFIVLFYKFPCSHCIWWVSNGTMTCEIQQLITNYTLHRISFNRAVTEQAEKRLTMYCSSDNNPDRRVKVDGHETYGSITWVRIVFDNQQLLTWHLEENKFWAPKPCRGWLAGCIDCSRAGRRDRIRITGA